MSLLSPAGWEPIITLSPHYQKFYQRPNHHSVTCVKPNGYNLSVASHTYVPEFIRAYDLWNYLLNTRNELNRYIYIITYTILSSTCQYIYFVFHFSKGCKYNV